MNKIFILLIFLSLLLLNFSYILPSSSSLLFKYTIKNDLIQYNNHQYNNKHNIIFKPSILFSTSTSSSSSSSTFPSSSSSPSTASLNTYYDFSQLKLGDQLIGIVTQCTPSGAFLRLNVLRNGKGGLKTEVQTFLSFKDMNDELLEKYKSPIPGVLLKRGSTFPVYVKEVIKNSGYVFFLKL